MYTKDSLRSFIFFDIETKPKFRSIDDMPIKLKEIWLQKHHLKGLEKEIENRKRKVLVQDLCGSDYSIIDHSPLLHNPTVDEIYIKESGLIPEFAEIFCISFGLFDPAFKPIITTFCEETEKETIKNFLATCHHFNEYYLFGYNTNEFDIPFLLKRMWVNGICDNYPPQLRLKDAKPWTVKNQDHMLNYKAGVWQSSSLDLLCEVFGINTPKDEFSNSEFTTLLMSGKISKEKAIRYCEKDVQALMELVLKVSSNKSNYENEVSTKIYVKK